METDEEECPFSEIAVKTVKTGSTGTFALAEHGGVGGDNTTHLTVAEESLCARVIIGAAALVYILPRAVFTPENGIEE